MSEGVHPSDQRFLNTAAAIETNLSEEERADVYRSVSLEKVFNSRGARRQTARKSTWPPPHPERSAGRTEELQPRCEVPAKRKQSDLTKPPRKVARKSTRPPAHPQKEKEPEVVDLDDEDEDIVEIETETNNVMSMLLESPSPDKQDLQELEEMVLS